MGFINNISVFLQQLPNLILFSIIVVLLFQSKNNNESSISKLLYPVGIILSIIWIIGFNTLLTFPFEMDALERHKYIGLFSAIFGNGFLILLYGIIASFVDKKEFSPQKLSIFKMTMLSIFTFGFYIPYWFILKFKEFNITKHKWMIILYIISLSILFQIKISQLSELSYEHIKIASFIISIIHAFIHFICLFTLQNMIEKRTNIWFKTLHSITFGFFYTQYKINNYETGDFDSLDDNQSSLYIDDPNVLV